MYGKNINIFKKDDFDSFGSILLTYLYYIIYKYTVIKY